MNAVKATWTNGQILPSEPVNWPEGIELRVEPELEPLRIKGATEEFWGADSKSIAAWECWLNIIEPFEYAEGEEAELEAYRLKYRQFNLDAVRRQMETGVM